MKFVVFALAASFAAAPAYAGSTVLSAGELRIDFAPSDFSILNTGQIGGTRGFAIRRVEGAGRSVVMGLGASYGVNGRLEVGAIVIPIGLSPDTGFGDITLHGRYRILTGTFEAAVQATMRLPTETNFGLGLGVPVVLHLDSVDIETGAEVELEFGGDTDAHLDVPITILVNVTREVFLGVRTGMFIAQFDRVDIPAGPVGGARIRVSNTFSLDAIAAFVFERFITGGDDGLFHLDAWTLHFGVAAHLLL